MSMSSAYTAHLGSVGPDVITHLGLVDDTGTELTGGDPAYARRSVTWTDAATARPTADVTFDVPGGSTVAGWRGFDAATGGTSYGGDDYDAADHETYANQGTYTLLAAVTGITHAAG